jgi:DNA-binding winged helix-turn-helix (wHTH) protein
MIYTFAGLELDTRSFELRRAQTSDTIATEPQVFDVLCYLVQHSDRVVSKEELLDSVWGTRFVTESALTSRIKDARRAVGDDGRSQEIIRTVHGRGYRFIAAVACTETIEANTSAVSAFAPEGANALLERERELTTLHAALDAARTQRQGSVVLVAGEAGLGKSTLVRAFADDVRSDDVRVLVGGCDDLIAPRTMGPLRDVAHELGGRLEAVFAREADAEQVFVALREVLAEQPVVCIVEDVHWADDATLDVIRFVARRISDLPAVLVVTYREEEVGSGHRLRRVLGSLTGTSVRRMVLAPLSIDAIARLAEGGPLAPDELFAVTRGNPFFVTEVLATGELRVPPTVRDAVLSRVDGLSPDTRNVLEHAAVIPSRAERSLLEALVPDAHLATAEAERAGVLSGDERAVWFRHELARHAVEESLTAAARVRANQQVLDVLAARDDVESARLVHHAEYAGDVESFIKFAPSAAREAIRLGSYSQAIHTLERLLAHADALSDRAVAVAASQLSYALYMVNRFADSARYGLEGVEAAEAVGDPAILADALLWLSRTLFWSDGPRAAVAAVERAMPLVENLDDARRALAHTEMARALSNLASVSAVAEANPAVVEHAERSLEFAERLHDSYQRCHALQYRGAGRVALRDDRGFEDLATAVELAQLDPRDEMPTRACVNAAGASLGGGKLDDAERYALLGLERVRGGEFTSGAYRLELTLQAVRCNRGDWVDAEAGLRALVDWPGEPGIMRPLAASLLARVFARQGRHEDAADLIEVAQRLTVGSSEIALVGPVTAAALEAAWLSGRVSDMAAIAAPALAIAREVGHRTTESEVTRFLQRAGCAVDIPADPVGPWAPAIAGRWREAADAWGARGCRYERAVECALAPDKDSRAYGRSELEALDARGTISRVGNP